MASYNNPSYLIMLSDKLQHIPSPKRTRVRKEQWYSDSHKLDAIKMYLLTGSLSTAAASLNIPLSTIKTWRYSKWWKEASDELRAEGRIQLSQSLKKVAEKALNVTMDRLENGDYQYDPKTGVIVRKPVNMRDAHRVASDLYTKHMELEQKPVEEEAVKATQDRLEALANTFASFSKKVKKIEVIDIEPT